MPRLHVVLVLCDPVPMLSRPLSCHTGMEIGGNAVSSPGEGKRSEQVTLHNPS